jgi:hypothetical protein
MNNRSVRYVIVGIRFNDTNRAAIVIGSNTQADCIPTKDNSVIPANKYSFIWLILFDALYEGFLCDSVPVQSIIVPIGHTQPQKNLPNTKVNTSINIENIIPGKTTRSLIDVMIVNNGFV